MSSFFYFELLSADHVKPEMKFLKSKFVLIPKAGPKNKRQSIAYLEHCGLGICIGLSIDTSTASSKLV